MPSFEYQAYDEAGKKRKGIVDADSPRFARQALREKGLFPLSVTKSIKSGTSHQFFFHLLRRKVAVQDLVLMTRQMGTLVNAGIPLERSLNMIAEQAEKTQLRKVVAAVRAAVAEGSSFSAALRNAPQRFPEEYIATIDAGEESGNMSQVLERLADDMEALNKTRQTFIAALIYPAVMVFVAISVIILLMVFVVPQVTEVFASQNHDLPRLTKFLIALSAFLRNYGLFILFLLLGGILVFNYALRRKEFRYSFDRLLARLPLIGKWIMMSLISSWARSLGLLIIAGVPTLKALQIAVRSVANSYLRHQLEEVNSNVSEGMSINRALSRSGIFPAFLVYMVNSGEQSGNLDGMLIKSAEYYAQLLATATQAALRLFEPLLILTMGIIVLVIILAILLPIFQINQLIL